MRDRFQGDLACMIKDRKLSTGLGLAVFSGLFV